MKTITIRFGVTMAVVLLISIALNVPTRAASGYAPADVINVINVEELYAAVNDPLSAGATIVLAPGIYELSPLGPGGQPRPNAGRLELKRDVSLIGVKGDRSAVVIEAIGLPASSFSGGQFPHAAIRAGIGSNSIEWLTVQNGRFGQGNIITSLEDDGTPHFRTAHIASSGAPNNLSIGNFGTIRAGKTMEVDIVDGDFFSGVGGFRNGFRIGNFSGATGAVMNVRLNGNRVWNDGFSIIVNNGVMNGTINVFSAGNRYFDNSVGLIVVGGLNGASHNTINYFGHGDQFLNNDDAAQFDKGGLQIFGADKPEFIPGGAVGNTVKAELFGCRMSGNAISDLLAVGGRAIVPALISTILDNHVDLTLHGMPNNKGNRVDLFADSIPYEPASNNSVTVKY